MFKQIVEEKGHTFEYVKKDKLQKTKISNEIYNNILDAPLISYEKSILYTQNQKTLNRDEKIKLQKYFMCHKLGLDVLTLDIIKKFYNKFYLILCASTSWTVYRIIRPFIITFYTKRVLTFIKTFIFSNGI